MSESKMRQNIEKAQKETDMNRRQVQEGAMRQKYHFMPQAGWMNDPNGLIWFKGKYHFFYQCNPYSGFWNCMHWGHAVSDDLVHWEYLPFALAPSEEYDNHNCGGCFSGSAIEHDGKLFLMYTAVANFGRGLEQTQCIAWSEDGITFEKYAGNPVIKAPEGVDIAQFRDPKVWKHDGMFYMVCAAKLHGRGQALLYRSEDFLHWSLFSNLSENRGEWGSMWECPDFFPLGDKYILTYSPIGVGDHTSVYQVGSFDYETGKFLCETSREIDWGFDYYAPQSFTTPDGRRIVVTWANEWEWMPIWKDWGPTYKEGWCGFFNIPRQVSLLEDNTLRFEPIKELQILREKPLFTDTLTVTERRRELTAGDGVSYELKFVIDLEKTDAYCIVLELRCGQDRKTVLELDLKAGEMRVDRSASDGWSEGISRSILFLKDKKELDIHVFSDQSSVEIFADGYQNNHSNNVFASSLQDRIYVFARGGSARLHSIESYGLKSAGL